ncbi:MAG: 2-oxoacid ferredoxin oxidoreductase [Planctomycetes bacterium RBG_13_60_9]|nr:MAG: 2-oxoacid ferredoxin oxidoreductase [Planctomycetes bacterium RBG_13_60_9]
MDAKAFDMGPIDIAWCPGCGNFPILKTLKEALAELNLDPTQVVMVSGIGQAAKTPHYVKAHVFNGLHGRALSPATAIKAANPRLTVIVESGDGDMYGEGGNHFMHTIRRNPDISVFVHDNMVYGLTKGQASPTSRLGFKTPVQTAGVSSEPFNPLAVAIALDAGFVARASAQDREQTKDLMKRAIQHKGFALVDIFQPCVTYNKLNTYEWFKANTYYLDDSHDPTNQMQALEKALQTDKLPLGVFYTNPHKPTFEETTGVYAQDPRPLHERDVDFQKLQDLIRTFETGA